MKIDDILRKSSGGNIGNQPSTVLPIPLVHLLGHEW